jgi:5-methylcytosine-specific restriction endonuclease McrA
MTACICWSRGCSDGGKAVPGTSRCRAHTTSGWGSKKNKTARDAMYASRSYRNYRHRILSAKPPCSYPGCTEVATTLDHIVAVSLGGDNSPSNLRPMCRSHNEALGRDLGNQMKRRRQW